MGHSTRLSAVFIVLAVLVAYGRLAGAASPPECRDYVVDALDSNFLNIAWSCGFGGPRWSSHDAGHARWCHDAPSEWLQSEQFARYEGLESCHCRNYARNAVDQNTTNFRNLCGFSGPRWSGNLDDHFNWCMTISRAQDGRYGQYNFNIGGPPRDEQSFRSAELARCRR